MQSPAWSGRSRQGAGDHRESAKQWQGSAPPPIGLAAAAACSIFENTVALMAALLVCGAGLGYFQAGYIEQTMRWMPADNSGVAGSLVASTRLMGLVIGVPILSACGAVFGITATLAGSAAVLAVWALCYRIAPR